MASSSTAPVVSNTITSRDGPAPSWLIPLDRLWYALLISYANAWGLWGDATPRSWQCNVRDPPCQAGPEKEEWMAAHPLFYRWHWYMDRQTWKLPPQFPVFTSCHRKARGYWRPPF